MIRLSGLRARRALTGALVVLMLVVGTATMDEIARAAPGPPVVKQLGGFKRPRGVDIDVAGNIYVADTENHMIRKFDTAGRTLEAWGGLGSDLGKLRYPRDVAVGPDGHVYVADTVNDRIQMFTARGTFLAAYGAGRGPALGQFDTPKSLALNSEGWIYVADTFNNRIQVLDRFGAPLFAWGRSGAGDGEFWSPTGVAVSRTGTVYVADSFHDRVQVFNAAGGFLRKWGFTGNGPGQFVTPRSVDLDAWGRVYVTDSDNHRIQVFAPDGTFLQSWGSRGVGADQFQNPKGIAVAPDGRVLVADQINNTLPIFGALSPIAPVDETTLARTFTFGVAAVIENLFDSPSGHNIANLRIINRSRVLEAGFLRYYVATGGVNRWGRALSEVFEEPSGVLTQYFERGAMDWRLRPELGIYILERRLAWDVIGGGVEAADSNPDPNNARPDQGIKLGPWGHRISNFAVDGSPTGFLDFFQSHGGEQSFGLPKSEARVDTGAAGTLLLPGLTPGFIRQYFQAAVMELHPGNPAFVTVANIGYQLLARQYGGEAWRIIPQFVATTELAAGRGYPVGGDKGLLDRPISTAAPKGP